MKGNIAVNYGTNYLRMSLTMQERKEVIALIDDYLIRLEEENIKKLDELS